MELRRAATQKKTTKNGEEAAIAKRIDNLNKIWMTKSEDDDTIASIGPKSSSGDF